jgi:hypothetical protein
LKKQYEKPELIESIFVVEGPKRMNHGTERVGAFTDLSKAIGAAIADAIYKTVIKEWKQPDGTERIFVKHGHSRVLLYVPNKPYAYHITHYARDCKVFFSAHTFRKGRIYDTDPVVRTFRYPTTY